MPPPGRGDVPHSFGPVQQAPRKSEEPRTPADRLALTLAIAKAVPLLDSLVALLPAGTAKMIRVCLSATAGNALLGGGQIHRQEQSGILPSILPNVVLCSVEVRLKRNSCNRAAGNRRDD